MLLQQANQGANADITNHPNRAVHMWFKTLCGESISKAAPYAMAATPKSG